MNEIPMDKYYKFRSELRDLYKNDVNSTGDLACKVLQIRDKNRCINSIDVSIQDGGIVIEFDDSTPQKKRKDLTHKITDSIGRFIIDNKEKIDIEEEIFDSIMNSGNSYCDIYAIGNEVTFGLF